MGTATKDHSGQERADEESDGEAEPRLLDRVLRSLAPPEEWTEAYSQR